MSKVIKLKIVFCKIDKLNNIHSNRREINIEKVNNYILKTVIFFVGWAILISFAPDIQTNNKALLRLWWEFVPLSLVVLFSFIFVLVIEKDKIKIPLSFKIL